ncbi:hypothetical protein AURANDRAFT_1129, partial [Aureococcus anophagefferens]
NSLVFDASFESANLLSAVQRGPKEYDLFLRADLHTEGFTQWFYFAVTNTHTHAALVTFNIVNLTKPDSLFNLGMQPVMYSCAEAVENGIGWVRTGTSVQYQANHPVDAGMTYYTLSFTLAFYRPDDIYLIAHSYPYTYSDHKAHIANLLRSSRKRRVTRHSALCRTLDSHECDLMTITSNENDLRSNECNTTSMPYLTRRKKLIILSARVHPGETPASWMMRGILEFLTGESNDAKILRSLFIFKIVPMLNPDGVIYGNNRCSLSGVDLNRQWKKPTKALHPTIYHLKSLIRTERAQREVVLFCDLHGHSRKQNIFMYGCDDRRKPRPAVRVFPKLLSWNEIGRKYVNFADCSFHVKKSREGTGRVVVAREMCISNSFTLEASFCGSNFGVLQNYHFNMGHFQEAGRSLCGALLDYYLPNSTQ